MGPLVTRLAATAAAALAAVVARQAVEYGWTTVRGEDPPKASDVEGDTELRDLLLWSALVVGAVVIARAAAKSAAENVVGAKAA